MYYLTNALVSEVKWPSVEEIDPYAGKNMTMYFIFVRKQRSSALLLVVNAGVALLLYVAAHKYLPNLTSNKNALTQRS